MSNQSLASRAIAALLLTVGFYLLALTIAAALLGFVYAEFTYLHEYSIKATILAIVGALAILWSIVPRIDRFFSPGPRLEEQQHPELFALLHEVSAATEQEMPREVYLIREVNAWVMQRGGIAGIGGRRVMAIGLPLLQTVTVAQLRAILAHEFGHYHGGDTKLGPWIFKTREAMRRTVANVARSASMLQGIFVWYANMFLRVTQSISRAQELAADRLAGRVAGAANLIDGLIAVHRAGAAYETYWTGEVVPVISNGFRTPFAAGLTQFMNAEDVQKDLAEFVERELTEGKADQYDSHPALRERVGALEPFVDPRECEAHSPLAITLLRDLDALEEALLIGAFINPKQAPKLTQVAWEETGSQVYLPRWKEAVAANEKSLQGLVVRAIPDVVTQHNVEGRNILASALAVRLANDGWTCTTKPGAQIRMTKDGHTMEPFLAVVKLGRRELEKDAWLAECEAAGIADCTLVS